MEKRKRKGVEGGEEKGRRKGGTREGRRGRGREVKGLR